MKKRLIALVMVMVLLLTAAATAFADTKPTAKLDSASKNQTVKPGKTIEFHFSLNSGSYKKKNNAFRSKLGINIVYKSKTVGSASWVWTGKQSYNLTAKVKGSAPVGKYTLKYPTYYRTKDSASWTKVKTQSTKFKVKK